MKFVIEHLAKRFEKKEVLRDITFTFSEGNIYGLLGRNGAGKTTLFNCLNRISGPTAALLPGRGRRPPGGRPGGHGLWSSPPPRSRNS